MTITTWRENYSSRPYITGGATFDEYGPAYRNSVDAYGRRDAWQHASDFVERATPGDSDHDGMST